MPFERKKKMSILKATPKTDTNLMISSTDGFRCLVKLKKGQNWEVTRIKEKMVELENGMVSILIPQDQFPMLFREFRIQE